MDSVSAITQLKRYTPAVQVTASVLGAIAITIIVTQSLSGMGLVILAGVVAVNIVVLVIATVLSCIRTENMSSVDEKQDANSTPGGMGVGEGDDHAKRLEIQRHLDNLFGSLNVPLRSFIEGEGKLRGSKTNIQGELAALDQIFVDVKTLYSPYLLIRHKSTSQLLLQRQIMAALHLENEAKVQSLLSEAKNEIQRVEDPEKRAINIIQGMTLSLSMQLLYFKYLLMNPKDLPEGYPKNEKGLFRYISDRLDRGELLIGCCSIVLEAGNHQDAKAKLDKLLNQLFRIKKEQGKEVAILPRKMPEGVREMFPIREDSSLIPEPLRATHIAIVFEKGFLPDNSLKKIKDGEKRARIFGGMASRKQLVAKFKEPYTALFGEKGFDDTDPCLRDRIASNIGEILAYFMVKGFYPAKSPFRLKLKSFFDVQADDYMQKMQVIAFKNYDRLDALVRELQIEFAKLDEVIKKAVA